MTVKAVFFDMGGTIETFGFTRELRLNAVPGLRSILLKAGVNPVLTDEELLDLVTSGIKQYHDLSIKSLDEYPTFRVWHEFILKDIPHDPELLTHYSEELMFTFEAYFYRREMRPEIPAVLEAIHGMGLQIGLISNVNSLGQVAFNLAKYSLSDYFHPVICSSEFGRRKPDPAIFHYAARLADTPASQCLYVGDRISRDVLGAKRAGFRLAVQIRHDFHHGEDDSGAIPDRVIEDMRDLVEIIRDENNRLPLVPPGEIRAFVFDAGDILYHRPEKGRRFREFLLSLGIDVENHHLEEREELAFRAYRGQLNQETYRTEILRLYGITSPGDLALGLKILQMEEDDVTFFEGVPETLHLLKNQGYLLGIITDTANTISAKLGWFEKGGFGQVWDSIISSMEFGTRKPDAVLYQAVLKQFNLQPGQAVFVGHKSSELEGARSVGMYTVAFNYEPGARANLYIDKFAELGCIAAKLTRLSQEIHF